MEHNRPKKNRRRDQGPALHYPTVVRRRAGVYSRRYIKIRKQGDDSLIRVITV